MVGYFNWVILYPMKHKVDLTSNTLTLMKLKTYNSVDALEQGKVTEDVEFLCRSFESPLSPCDIRHPLTVPYPTRLNNIDEGMKCTQIRLTKIYPLPDQVDKKLLAESLSTASYVRNRVTV